MTNERIKELGIIKMNDYLATGTRQQFWEEYYVKVVMQVRNFFFERCEGKLQINPLFSIMYARLFGIHIFAS